MKEERERKGERKREAEGEKERERERCSLCRFRMTNRDWYLHVKSSTKYRYVRYKISDLSVRYSMFRDLHRITHLSDVICAIPGCTQINCAGTTVAQRCSRAQTQLGQHSSTAQQNHSQHF